MNEHPISTRDAVSTWKLAHRFVLDVYKLTSRLPRDEHYGGLIPKIRSSSVKIASNIVEGYARKTPATYLQHLTDSQVALEETKYSLLVARDLGYISEHTYDRTMSDAEQLSERLTHLQAQLTSAAALTAPAQPAREGGWFKVETGVRHTVRGWWNWLRGDQRQPKRLDGNVWAEESPTKNYLDEARD